MAYEETLVCVTLDADSSIATYTGVPGIPGAPANQSGKQYRFVKLTGEHQVGLVTTPASDAVVGVVQSKPQNTGMEATVAVLGVSKVEAGGAISAGAAVYTDSSGRATTTASGSILGYALHSVAATGQLATVLLRLK